MPEVNGQQFVCRHTPSRIPVDLQQIEVSQIAVSLVPFPIDASLDESIPMRISKEKSIGTKNKSRTGSFGGSILETGFARSTLHNLRKPFASVSVLSPLCHTRLRATHSLPEHRTSTRKDPGVVHNE